MGKTAFILRGGHGCLETFKIWLRWNVSRHKIIDTVIAGVKMSLGCLVDAFGVVSRVSETIFWWIVDGTRDLQLCLSFFPGFKFILYYCCWWDGDAGISMWYVNMYVLSITKKEQPVLSQFTDLIHQARERVCVYLCAYVESAWVSSRFNG